MPGQLGASGATGGCTTGSSPAGESTPAGIPQRNVLAGVGDDPVVATTGAAAGVDRPGLGVDGALPGRGPDVFTRIDCPSSATSTVPSVSVRYVRPASSCSRSIVAGAGWPYGLPAPADATATLGRTRSRNARVLAVFDP